MLYQGLAQHVAGNSEPELVYSAIFAPTNDELFDVMVIIPLDGRAIYIYQGLQSAEHVTLEEENLKIPQWKNTPYPGYLQPSHFHY